MEDEENVGNIVYFAVRIKSLVYYKDNAVETVEEHTTKFLEVTVKQITQHVEAGKQLDLVFADPENYAVLFKQVSRWKRWSGRTNPR